MTEFTKEHLQQIQNDLTWLKPFLSNRKQQKLARENIESLIDTLQSQIEAALKDL